MKPDNRINTHDLNTVQPIQGDAVVTRAKHFLFGQAYILRLGDESAPRVALTKTQAHALAHAILELEGDPLETVVWCATNAKRRKSEPEPRTWEEMINRP